MRLTNQLFLAATVLLSTSAVPINIHRRSGLSGQMGALLNGLGGGGGKGGDETGGDASFTQFLQSVMGNLFKGGNVGEWFDDVKCSVMDNLDLKTGQRKPGSRCKSNFDSELPDFEDEDLEWKPPPRDSRDRRRDRDDFEEPEGRHRLRRRPSFRPLPPVGDEEEDRPRGSRGRRPRDDDDDDYEDEEDNERPRRRPSPRRDDSRRRFDDVDEDRPRRRPAPRGGGRSIEDEVEDYWRIRQRQEPELRRPRFEQRRMRRRPEQMGRRRPEPRRPDSHRRERRPDPRRERRHRLERRAIEKRNSPKRLQRSELANTNPRTNSLAVKEDVHTPESLAVKIKSSPKVEKATKKFTAGVKVRPAEESRWNRPGVRVSEA